MQTEAVDGNLTGSSMESEAQRRSISWLQTAENRCDFFDSFLRGFGGCVVKVGCFLTCQVICGAYVREISSVPHTSSYFLILYN